MFHKTSPLNVRGLIYVVCCLASGRNRPIREIGGGGPSQRKSVVHAGAVWFSSAHIVAQQESPTNAPCRYQLRLRRGGFRAGDTVALSRMRQDRNHEGVDPRRGLRRRHDEKGRARRRFTSERPTIIAGPETVWGDADLA